jgi:hypothetical protein
MHDEAQGELVAGAEEQWDGMDRTSRVCWFAERGTPSVQFGRRIGVPRIVILYCFSLYLVRNHSVGTGEWKRRHRDYPQIHVVNFGSLPESMERKKGTISKHKLEIHLQAYFSDVQTYLNSSISCHNDCFNHCWAKLYSCRAVLRNSHFPPNLYGDGCTTSLELYLSLRNQVCKGYGEYGNCWYMWRWWWWAKDESPIVTDAGSIPTGYYLLASFLVA